MREWPPFVFDGVEYMRGSAGSLILACPVCGDEHFREPINYFWSLYSDNKAWMERGQKNYWGAPEWHKCVECPERTQMEPIRMDELESRWKPFWRSLGHIVAEEGRQLERVTSTI